MTDMITIERETLEKIAGVGTSQETPGHYNNAPHLRCRSCGHRWAPGIEPEHHSTNCAAVIARAALEETK